MTGSPRVSVGVPTYNRPAGLKRAVEAIYASGYPALEVLISDNGSSPETGAAVAELMAQHPTIRYHRFAENQGPTPNFRQVRAMATGHYFMWHGDDDWLDQDYVARCVARLEAEPSLTLVAGRSCYRLPDGSVQLGNVIDTGPRPGLPSVLRYLAQVRDNSIFYGVYRASAMAGVPLHNALAADWAWVASIIARGGARVIPDLHINRDASGNTSSSLKRICQVLGVPLWHARLSWLAIARNVANQTDLGPAAATWAARTVGWLAIFTVVFLRFPTHKAIRLGQIIRSRVLRIRPRPAA